LLSAIAQGKREQLKSPRRRCWIDRAAAVVATLIDHATRSASAPVPIDQR
jgi:hypothetical protein